MSETQRIAFISSLELGGATTFLCHLGGELTRRQIPIVVISPENKNAFASDFENAGVRVILHDNRRLIFEDRLEAMLRTLAEFRPTIAVGCLGTDSYEVLRHVPAGVRRVAMIQADDSKFYEAAAPYAGCLDKIVGVSARITEKLELMDEFRNVSKTCLRYGVPMPQRPPPRGDSGLPLRILYLGRIIDDQKRVHLFPGILAVLKESRMPFQWTIAGDGAQRADLERSMASNDPQQLVVFPGSLPNAQVPDLLEKHDIFLLTSDYEGLPLSLLEAMGHGLVPVVSDLESGMREVVNVNNGFLVDVDCVEGYARAIIHLHQHRDELAAKSVAAREQVCKEFSVEAMTDRWLAVFPQVPPGIGAWQTKWDIKPLWVARHPAYSSPPMRVLRRLAKKFQHIGKN